jgi:hypothetical protein
MINKKKGSINIDSDTITEEEKKLIAKLKKRSSLKGLDFFQNEQLLQDLKEGKYSSDIEIVKAYRKKKK